MEVVSEGYNDVLGGKGLIPPAVLPVRSHVLPRLLALSDLHVGFPAVVYGHLHIPRVTWHDGVRFEEVSMGYPREWQRRSGRPGVPRQILPAAGGEPR
jgi:hypothetical protein